MYRGSWGRGEAGTAIIRIKEGKERAKGSDNSSKKGRPRRRRTVDPTLRNACEWPALSSFNAAELEGVWEVAELKANESNVREGRRVG